MPRKLTTQEFTNKANIVHDSKYDYSETVYFNGRDEVKIICPIHGEFWKNPKNHIYAKKPQGCPKCGQKKAGEKRGTSFQEFLHRAHEIYGDFFDYSKAEKTYTNHLNSDIIIICPIHGEFAQIAFNHITYYDSKSTKYACHECKKDSQRMPFVIFLQTAKKVHNSRYTYKNTVPLNIKFAPPEVTITCKKHGDFTQLFTNHLKGSGCPRCARLASWGIRRIEAFLSKNKIHFKPEKSFHDLYGDHYPLRYDFHLPDYNLLIEYDGQFHFMETGYSDLDKIQRYDRLKNDYATNNKIQLLRIDYTQHKEIYDILRENILFETSF